jgi:hyperosmotically inducible protein
MSKRTRPIAAAALAVATAALAACGRADDDRSAGQKVDAAVAASERRADELRADASQAMQAAEKHVSEAARATGEKLTDGAITAEINAGLAQDAKLSAVKIDVDTKDGVVTLKGPAPDDSSRVRATQIAATPKGVVRVENRLEVK